MEAKKQEPGTVYVEVLFNIPLKQSFTYKWHEEIPSMGVRVEARLKNRKATGWVISCGTEAPQGYTVHSLERVVDKELLFDQKILDLADWLSRFYLCSLGEALFTLLPGGRVEKELPALGTDEPLPEGAILELTEEQNRAMEAMEKNPHGFWYLHGITGSGKTELYLRMADQMLEQGRGVIYLVPEISLTHQMTDRLEQRYGTKMALLHSHLTPSQRLKEWKRIQRGEAPFVLGARSAVFAPLKDLGLIILDEEHETSYKAGSTPRYHGRQVAMYRCRQEKGMLIMGSATPSLEAWSLMEQGQLQRISLKERAAGGGIPHIELVSMKGEKGILSEILVREIRRVTGEGNQVILFLNRRGFSYHFHCRSCGYELHCRQCSVPLTFHKERNRMVCHYCGYQTPPPTRCPDCGSMEVGYSGFGTEQIEEEIQRLFPDLGVLRLDRDVAEKKGETKRILAQFQKGEKQILLGTQMVAKGLNFPRVRLVGIILADTSLNLPDFRSPERTFGLVTQVAGRAGRYSTDGRVILQTFRPESPALALAAHNRLEEFYKQEWDMRKILRFPPAVRLIRLVFRSRKSCAAEDCAEQAAAVLRSWGLKDLLGPAECALGMVSGNYRYQILIRAEDFSRSHQLVGAYLDKVEAPSNVYREVDVDPQSLL